MKVLDIALRDMLSNFRSAFAVGFMFVLPLLITGLIYMAFGRGDSAQVSLPVTSVVVVDQDAPPAGSPDFGQMLLGMLNDPSVAQWLHASTASSVDEATRMVNDQQASMALVIPGGFSQAIIDATGRPQVRLIQDPTLTIGPMVVQNMIGSLLDGASGARIALQAAQERQAALGVAPDAAAQEAYLAAYQAWFTAFQRDLYHSSDAALVSQAPAQQSSGEEVANPMQNILPLILTGMAIFFGFFTGAFAMQSILKEDEEGTLARIFSTPTSRTTILAGKFLAVVLMVTVQGLVMVLAGIVIFQVNWGNPLDVTLALVGQVIGATSLGVLLISLVKNTRQSGPVLGGALSALGMIGGLFTLGMGNMPPAFDTLGLFTPHGWVLRVWRLTLNGAAPIDLLLPLGVLFVMGIIMFAIGAVRFQRRYA